MVDPNYRGRSRSLFHQRIFSDPILQTTLEVYQTLQY